MQESKNFCANYLTKFSIDLDGIGHTVEMCWATKRLELTFGKTGWHQVGSHQQHPWTYYNGNVHPVMEYGAAAWATAAKSNSSRLGKVQNKGVHVITGKLKTTPTFVMETAT